MKMTGKIFGALSLRKLRLTVHTIGLSVVAAIAAMGHVTYFLSTETQEATLQNEIANDVALLSSREAIMNAREMTECELFAMSRRLEELTAMIPDAPEESHFLAQLAALASDAQLSIQNFRPGPAEDTHQVKRIRVQLAGAGSYECICSFLNGLQALPRLTHVSRLKIDPPIASGQYPVELELSIFFADRSTETRIRVAKND